MSLQQSNTENPGEEPASRTRRWWPFAAAVFLVGLILGAGLRGGPPMEFVATGRAVPIPKGALEPTSLEDFNGVLVGLRGLPVVVNVWASWCGPCRTEAPLLQRAADRYGKEVVFLGVDTKDDPAAARDFLERYDIRYPNLFDSDGNIRRALNLRGFPTTYIFGRDGRLQSSVFGGISEQTLAARVADARR